MKTTTTFWSYKDGATLIRRVGNDFEFLNAKNKAWRDATGKVEQLVENGDMDLEEITPAQAAKLETKLLGDAAPLPSAKAVK